MNRKERRNYAKRFNTPQKLEQYAKTFDTQIRKEYDQVYKEKYQRDLEQSIDNFIIAIVYTLHFNEDTKMENEQLEGFMEDLLVTIDMFRTKEYNPDDYVKALQEDNIKIIRHNSFQKNTEGSEE